MNLALKQEKKKPEREMKKLTLKQPKKKNLSWACRECEIMREKKLK